MLEIYNYYLHETTRAVRQMWERVGAQEVTNTQNAQRIEEAGGLAFVDYSKNPKNRKNGFEFTYVEPVIPEDCNAARAWYRLRGEVMSNTISLAVAAEEGPFWVREEQNGFMHSTAPDLLTEYEPLEGCECDKKARILQIKRLLGLEPVEQGSIESRIQITSRYTDLEQLLGLNPEAPKPPFALDVIVDSNPPFSVN